MKGFVAIALYLAGTALVAAEEIRQIIDASEDGLVSISNPAGSIEVKGWSRNQVEVNSDLGRGVEELIFERDGNEVKILVRVPRNNARGTSSDLEIRVPQNSSVKIAGVSADIVTNDVHGSQRLQTVSGDIDTYVFESDIDIDTVSGDITVRGDDKELHATIGSVSGDIDVVGLSGEIETGSVSGDVTVADGRFTRVSMNTTSGDIVFRAQLLNKGRLDVETINGDVDIDFTGAISARFDVETFNGDIRNCFGPESRRTSKYAPGRELVFTEGGGSGRVTIRTLNGDLQMCRD
ncbi:hypothetical protein BA177_17730 [Woeseia oceani]|uniref:DUF4097 domain-containing protein n=2 Tax=Woeseia oceani TaxID=1548547 RepID=A0A193LJU5_9GAMM|nr:hypothetical protein BA177_17730 [Woeseia oceani]